LKTGRKENMLIGMNPQKNNLFEDIPPAKAMGIAVSKQWENGLELCAPFECNRNDKSTAFAGSTGSFGSR
jgi:hypothetical protein